MLPGGLEFVNGSAYDSKYCSMTKNAEQHLLSFQNSNAKLLRIKDIFDTIYGKAYVYARCQYSEEDDIYVPVTPRDLYVVKTHDKLLLKMKKSKKGGNVQEDPEGEVRILTEIVPSHPYIISLTGFCEGAKYFYSIYPYIPGGELFDIVSHPDALMTEKEIRRIFKKIAIGTNFLHSNGIVHCDISPENVLLDANKDPVIIDFGLAHEMNDSGHIVPKSKCVGKFRYMAPEMYRGNSPLYGPAIDVWSLGATLFVMHFGVPFTEYPCPNLSGNYNFIVLQKKLKEALEKWNFTNASPNAIDLMQKMLDADPMTRITIADILKHPYFNDEEEDVIQNMEIDIQR